MSLPMAFKVFNVLHELAERTSKGINYNDGTSEPINEEQTQTDEEDGMSGGIESERVDHNTAVVDAKIAGVGAAAENPGVSAENTAENFSEENSSVSANYAGGNAVDYAEENAA